MSAIRILSVLVLGAGALIAFVPSADAATVTVSAGQSIQTAIDNASPGDTISIGPGTFAPFVVDQNDLTVVGHNTVVQAPSSSLFAVCVSPDPGCTFGPPSGVVTGDVVRGITAVGNAPSFGDAFDVIGGENVTLTNDSSRNDVDDGFDIFFSSDVTVSNSRSTQDVSGFDAEVSQGITFTGDQASKDAFGFFSYQSEGVSVTNSLATGGCDGLIAEGNSFSLTVSHNVFRQNTKLCPEIGSPQVLKGIGALFLGASQVQFTDNIVQSNGTAKPRSNYTGGLIVDQTPSDAGNVFSGNAFSGNLPRDIWTDDTDPADNSFTGNACSVSVPPGLC